MKKERRVQKEIKMSDIKEFVEYVVKELVDKPEEIQVSEKEGEQALIFEISVAKSDFGKVVGKHGKNVEALRLLVRAVSAKSGKRALLEVNEQ
jgi:predicted RNA-binding protein YlqC (UPF0109 family)